MHNTYNYGNGFVEELIEKVLPIWQDCIDTKFVEELKTGELSDERFKQYIIQDTIYLKHYARVFGMGLYHAKTMREVQMYYSVLSFVNGTETSTRMRYMKQFNIDEDYIETVVPLKENSEYFGFMIDTAKNGNTAEIMMAILPCMISYNYIFRKLAEAPETKNSKYYDFIADYLGEAYTTTCITWAKYTDSLCKNATETEKAKYLEIFKRSSELEVDFWNMSYRAGGEA